MSGTEMRDKGCGTTVGLIHQLAETSATSYAAWGVHHIKSRSAAHVEDLPSATVADSCMLVTWAQH